MNHLQYLIWTILHRREYNKRKYDTFAILVEKMDKREKFYELLRAYVKKDKKVPKEFIKAYLIAKKEAPWNKDKKVINQMRRTVKRTIKNEMLNKSIVEKQMRRFHAKHIGKK